jgi:hypothetical protein
MRWPHVLIARYPNSPYGQRRKKLQGKVAVITGGNSGIGLTIKETEVSSDRPRRLMGALAFKLSCG